MTMPLRIFRPVLAATLALWPFATAMGQPAPSPTTKEVGTPATPPSPGADSGTKPGNEGSTGWSGGTGGSFTGTSKHAPTPGSKTEQPETAKGLNPGPTK